MAESAQDCEKEIVVKCVAKGYHECLFHEEKGEKLSVLKNVGAKGRAHALWCLMYVIWRP